MSINLKDLPYSVHQDLCRILDDGEEWRKLVERMGFNAFVVSVITDVSRRTGVSPTRVLLNRWIDRSRPWVHTSNELFVLLYRMRHVPAMRCLVKCVDVKCLRLLTNLRPDWRTFIPEENANRRTPNSDAVPEIGKSDDSIPRIPYIELTQATNNWAKENLLGKGAFGEVFKGEWKQTLVAIKRLKSTSTEESTEDNRSKSLNQQFLRELSLNGYRHDNLLPLYGHSVEGGSRPCLVYQLMSWSLLQRLMWRKWGHAPLTWAQRLDIAIGTARIDMDGPGLQFLHFRTSTALIHGDIKPGNILLDSFLEPKIGDFGLARNGPFGDDHANFMVSKVQGTSCYLPEDYKKTQILSTAVDVFSFGMILFEMATALRVKDKTRGDTAWLWDHMHMLARRGEQSGRLIETLVAMEDPILLNSQQHSMPALCVNFIMLGLECTQYDPSQRPNMKDVFKILNSYI